MLSFLPLLRPFFFFFLLFSRGLNFHPWYKKTSSSPSCVFNGSNLCSLQPFSPSELMWDTWGNAGWVEANHLSFEKEKKRKVSVRNFLITADSEVVTNDKESGHEAMKKSSLAPMKISLHLRRELDTTHEFVHQNWASGVSKLCGGFWVTERSPERKMNERHAITMTAAGFFLPQKNGGGFLFFGAWLFCLTHPVIYQQSWVYAKSLVWKLLLSLRRRVAVKPQSALSARGGTFSLMIFLLQDPFCQCWTVSVTLANEWTPSCDTVFNIHRVGGRRRKWSMCHRARN